VDASASAASSSASPSTAASSPATSLHLTDPPAPVASRPTGGVTGTLTGVGLIAVIAAAAVVIGLRRRLRARPAGATAPMEVLRVAPPAAPLEAAPPTPPAATPGPPHDGNGDGDGDGDAGR
jgi:hypothetical protein